MSSLLTYLGLKNFCSCPFLVSPNSLKYNWSYMIKCACFLISNINESLNKNRQSDHEVMLFPRLPLCNYFFSTIFKFTGFSMCIFCGPGFNSTTLSETLASWPAAGSQSFICPDHVSKAHCDFLTLFCNTDPNYTPQAATFKAERIIIVCLAFGLLCLCT